VTSLLHVVTSLMLITKSLRSVVTIQHTVYIISTLGWRRGVMVNGVGLINKVNQHLARLVLGWVTIDE